GVDGGGFNPGPPQLSDPGASRIGTCTAPGSGTNAWQKAGIVAVGVGGTVSVAVGVTVGVCVRVAVRVGVFVGARPQEKFATPSSARSQFRSASPMPSALLIASHTRHRTWRPAHCAKPAAGAAEQAPGNDDPGLMALSIHCFCTSLP